TRYSSELYFDADALACGCKLARPLNELAGINLFGKRRLYRGGYFPTRLSLLLSRALLEGPRCPGQPDRKGKIHSRKRPAACRKSRTRRAHRRERGVLEVAQRSGAPVRRASQGTGLCGKTNHRT